jgi:hypothetical protein
MIALPDELGRTLDDRGRRLVLEGLRRTTRDPVYAATTLRGWAPHPGQAEVLRALDVREGTVKLALVNCGTGWGKSDLIAELHAEIATAIPGAKCLMASRTQEQANLAFKRLVVSMTTSPLMLALVDRVVASPYPTLVLKNGAFITARTTKDDCVNLRGPEWDFISLDEAAFGDEFAWHFLTTRVRMSNGPVIGFSSPSEEWFEDLWHEFDDARLDGKADVYAYTGPATENPHLSPEFFARMKERLPDLLYRQEVLAEFVSSNVHTFRREHLERIFDDALPASSPPVRGHRYGLGWDLAVESAAAVGIALDAHMETWRGSSWPHVQRRVEETARAYRGAKAIDYTGVGNAAGQNLRVHVREEEKFVFSGPSRYELCVEAMKFVETMADLERPIVSLALPTSGPWGELRNQMRKHKISIAKKKDSKSLGGAGAVTWDELDAFLLAVHATKVALSRSGSLLEYVAA